MNTRPIPVLLLLPLLLALSACGNKGPLVLPDEADAGIEADADTDADADAADESGVGIDGMPAEDTGTTLDDDNDTDADVDDAIGDDPLDDGRD